MKTNRTELVFILDRSGSMCGLERDTIGGFNAMLEQQKGETGEAVVTTVLFDDRYELLHDRIDLRGVAPITEREYFVRGTTALLDAVGRTINKIAAVQRYTAPGLRADKVLFVITTDGYENASREFSHGQIKAMIQREREEYGWEFLFLGANIDAVAAAGQLGIREDRAVTCHADSQAVQLNYQTISAAVSSMRACGQVPSAWKAPVERDFQGRRAKR